MVGRFAANPSGDEYSSSLKAAGNYEIILTGERYTATASALKGSADVRAHAPAAAEDAQTRP